MPDVPLEQHVCCQIIFLVFLVVFLIQCLFYWIIFVRLAFYKEKDEMNAGKSVSVVICARNEYHHLKENLPSILEQDYKDFEVVVVNHASDDDSSFLLARMSETYPHLRIVEIRENLNFFTGKKFPLSIGIKSAKHNLILLTDADCKPAGKNWIAGMASAFSGEKQVVLGYGAYDKGKGLLNKLIRFETAHIAIQYLSYALAGIPYMGVGRNMAYRKSLFIENKGFISHYRIDSGDDDLFINRVAKRKNTRIRISPESFTYSSPKLRWRDWMFQKKRHLSTARYYKWFHKLMLGTYSLTQFLFYLGFAVLLIMDVRLYLVLGIMGLRLAGQMLIFQRSMSKLNEKRLWIAAPFFEIFFLFLNASVALSNVISKPKRWK